MKQITLLIIYLWMTPLAANGFPDTMSVKTIKGITDKMLELISGEIDEPRDWDTYRNLFLPTAQKISVRHDVDPRRQVRVMNLEEFVRNVGPLYKRDGFVEFSTGLTINEYNGIATAFQSYEAKNLLGTYHQKGVNCYQLVYSNNRWWIANTLFVSEDPNNKIPSEYLHQPTWSKLNTPPFRGKQDDITFIDENRGWYVNGHGKIYHTKDGGETWEKQIEQPGTFFRSIAFIDKNVGFAGTVGTDYYPNVSDTIALYGTKDGGITWKPVDYEGPYVKGLCAIDVVKEPYIYQGVLKDKYHVYAVGRVGSPANFMVSHDGGETWTSKSMGEHCQMMFDIKMFDKNVGIACASTDVDPTKSNALVLKTYDGGNTWKKVYQSNRFYENVWKVSFPTEKVGYATIQTYDPDPEKTQQRVIKTVDGGETWEELDLVKDKGARSFGVGFIDENHGYVGTMNSGYETKDGGQTWQPVDLGKACNKIRIYRNEKGETYGYSIGMDVFKLNFK